MRIVGFLTSPHGNSYIIPSREKKRNERSFTKKAYHYISRVLPSIYTVDKTNGRKTGRRKPGTPKGKEGKERGRGN